MRQFLSSGYVKLSLICCSLCFLFSCEKDDPVHSEVPAIEFLSATPDSVTENQSITFSIKYTDGDGDLGADQPNVYNLFLTDTRVNVTYQYRIKQLAPDNSTITITGTLNILLNSTAIIGEDQSQDVIYSMYVVDRAGHQSNVITCPAIHVHK